MDFIRKTADGQTLMQIQKGGCVYFPIIYTYIRQAGQPIKTISLTRLNGKPGVSMTSSKRNCAVLRGVPVMTQKSQSTQLFFT